MTWVGNDLQEASADHRLVLSGLEYQEFRELALPASKAENPKSRRLRFETHAAEMNDFLQRLETEMESD